MITAAWLEGSLNLKRLYLLETPHVRVKNPAVNTFQLQFRPPS